MQDRTVDIAQNKLKKIQNVHSEWVFFCYKKCSFYIYIYKNYMSFIVPKKIMTVLVFKIFPKRWNKS